MEQNLELVEKLVEKTGVSYAQAKEALEQTDWDILEALILLESQGKINRQSAAYSTRKEEEPEKEEQPPEKNASRFGAFLRDLIDKGNKNCLEVHRSGELVLSVPVNVCILLFLFCFWVVLPVMLVSLFFDCRYSFSGTELGKDSVNKAMGKATDIADDIKKEISK